MNNTPQLYNASKLQILVFLWFKTGGTVLLHLGFAPPGRSSSLGQIRSNDAAARAPADFSADRGSARSCTGAGACGGHPHVGPGGPGGHVQRQGDQGGEGGGDAYRYFNLLGAFRVKIEGWGAYIGRRLLHLVIRPPDM